MTTQKRIKIAEKRLKQLEKEKLKFSQSNIKINRTFKSWFYELRKSFNLIIELEYAEMFYNGGYSPKMTYLEVNRIPVGWDVL